MDFMNRIQQIETRICDIESQVNSAAPPVEAGGADFQAMLKQQIEGSGGASTLPQGATAWAPGSTPAGLAEASAVPGGATANATSTNLPVAAAQFDPIVAEAASQYNVDPNLVKSLIQQESAFNPTAKSNCGAMGLMQLIPETAKDLGCADAFDPHQNVMAGTKYLKQLLDQYHGDSSLALAAYNAGAANVDKYGGIPPFAETQNYVKNILSNYSSWKRGS